MNKHLTQVLKATVILLMFCASESTAQAVILVNGVPTKVVLEGVAIKTIVQQKVTDYMEEYGQEPNDSFTKSVITFNPVDKVETQEKIKAKETLTEKRQLAAVDDIK